MGSYTQASPATITFKKSAKLDAVLKAVKSAITRDKQTLENFIYDDSIKIKDLGSLARALGWAGAKLKGHVLTLDEYGGKDGDGIKHGGDETVFLLSVLAPYIKGDMDIHLEYEGEQQTISLLNGKVFYYDLLDGRGFGDIVLKSQENHSTKAYYLIRFQQEDKYTSPLFGLIALSPGATQKDLDDAIYSEEFLVARRNGVTLESCTPTKLTIKEVVSLVRLGVVSL